MMGRVLTAYRIELAKAARQPYTYIGLALVACVVLCTPLNYAIARDNVCDYAFIAQATPMALNLLGLFVLITYCAGLVASEVHSGTARMVLVRPLRRSEFVFAKILLGMTYAVLLTSVTAGLSWGLAFAFGDVNGVTYGGETLYTSTEMLFTYGLGMGLALLPQFAVVSFSVMMSCLTRATSSAIGASLGLWILLDLVKHPLRIAPYVFSTYLEWPWRIFAQRCDGLDAFWLPDVWYLGVTSVASWAVFTVIAMLALVWRNLNA